MEPCQALSNNSQAMVHNNKTCGLTNSPTQNLISANLTMDLDKGTDSYKDPDMDPDKNKHKNSYQLPKHLPNYQPPTNIRPLTWPKVQYKG